MNDYNPELVLHKNAKPSSGVRRVWRKVAQCPFPDTIIVAQMGAVNAVTTLAHGNTTKLGADCFCRKYAESGKPNLATIVSQELLEGISLAQLRKSLDKFKGIKAPKGVTASARVKAKEVTRGVMVVRRMVLPKDTEFKRGK